MLGLAWEDVDLDAGELVLAWQLQRVDKRLLRRETKTDTSDSMIPMPDICVTALRGLKAETDDREAIVGRDWMGCAVLCSCTEPSAAF